MGTAAQAGGVIFASRLQRLEPTDEVSGEDPLAVFCCHCKCLSVDVHSEVAESLPFAKVFPQKSFHQRRASESSSHSTGGGRIATLQAT